MVRVDSKDPAPYNMSALNYIYLHELIKAKSRALITGDFPMYNDVLEEIYIAVSIKMTEKQIEDMDKRFSDAQLKLRNKSDLTRTFYRLIDRDLMKIMHKNGMIFSKSVMPNIEDLRKRYKLSVQDNNVPNGEENENE